MSYAVISVGIGDENLDSSPLGEKFMVHNVELR